MLYGIELGVEGFVEFVELGLGLIGFVEG